MQSFNATLIDNDFEIIQNLKLGGTMRERAVDVLYKKYAYAINQGVHKRNLLEEEAFDAYTDTILSTVDSVIKESFESRSSLKTYLLTIFDHKCVDIIRKKTTNKMSVHRTADIELMTDVLPDAVKTVLQKLIEEADYGKLHAQLELLGEKCKQLLNLFAQDYPDKEIAKIAGYKTGEVAKTSRIRCLEKLRQLYK
jgi:RNA polymerase sigma factor (sigma-70 family)